MPRPLPSRAEVGASDCKLLTSVSKSQISQNNTETMPRSCKGNGENRSSESSSQKKEENGVKCKRNQRGKDDEEEEEVVDEEEKAK